MSTITVFNVFYNPGCPCASDIKDIFIGTTLSEPEAQDLCNNYNCEGDWDPYFTIVPVSSWAKAMS